jgi:hypothetical protein
VKQEMTLAEALRWLERHGKRSTVEGMARYGIPSEGAYGVTVGELRAFAKRIGRDHALAQALWSSGRYEARMLAAFVDDPAEVTVGQMNAVEVGGPADEARSGSSTAAARDRRRLCYTSRGDPMHITALFTPMLLGLALQSVAPEEAETTARTVTREGARVAPIETTSTTP